jgi:hypothetical protein
VVIPDSARWSKPSTGGRTEDEAHNFDRIVNSWYLNPEGMKFSQWKNYAGMRFLKTLAQKGSSGNLLLQRSKAGHLPTGLLLHSAGLSVGAEPGDFARPSETSRHFVSCRSESSN